MVKVVIVGGGWAGTAVARELDKHAPVGSVEITLVDPKERFVHKIGSLRASVQADWAEKVLVPRDALLARTNGMIVEAAADRISETAVELDTGARIPFDYCVLATGARNRSPGEPPRELRSAEALAGFYQANADAVRAATRVAIIGGGVVGVELAGEIKSKHPTTEVTIIHSGDTLMNGVRPPLSPYFHTLMRRQMHGMGIRVLLNERADIDPSAFADSVMIPGERTLRMTSGARISVDLVIFCVGASPNSEAMPSSWVDASKHVRVDRNLRVLRDDGSSLAHIFAVGDLAGVDESKMAFFADFMASMVVRNLVALVRGRRARAVYRPHGDTPLLMAVPLGPQAGVSQLPFGAAMGPILTVPSKSHSLMIERAWANNNNKKDQIPAVGEPSVLRDMSYPMLRTLGSASMALWFHIF